MLVLDITSHISKIFGTVLESQQSPWADIVVVVIAVEAVVAVIFVVVVVVVDIVVVDGSPPRYHVDLDGLEMKIYK